MSEFLIGAAYYPEWWDESRWEEDFSGMAELGFTAVRMGEFAWSWFEPSEGRYDFEPMRRAIACAGRFGIRTILGTPTAVCPPWLYRKDPYVKGGNERGDYDFGGRKGNCLSSSVFLAYAEKIVEAEADALGNDPNVAGWQLDNEPGFPFVCLDGECERGFREWLRERYGGDISRLNRAWFTVMWSNSYTDFSEICFPVNAAEGGWSPGMQLDYRRYFSFLFHRLLSHSAEIIRTRSPGRFLYANWPGANWSVSCRDAKYLDFHAWDNYVGQPQGENYRVQLRASFEHSFCRCLSGGKNTFFVAEQAAYAGPNNLPEVLRAQTWLNVSHGAFGTIFFEWRTPPGGPEQGYGGVLGLDGKFTETAPVFRELSAQVRSIYRNYLEGSKTVSDAAVLYSYESSWATRGWRVDGAYDEELFCAYGGFRNALQRNMDVVTEAADFSGYRLIAAPNLRCLSEETAQKLTAFVRAGGIAVLNADCGTHDLCNLQREMNPPGLFAQMCGTAAARRIDARTLSAETGEAARVRYADGTETEADGQCFVPVCPDSETAAVYASAGRLSGKPAVTVRRYGDGWAVFCASFANGEPFYETLARYLAGRFGIPPIAEASDGVILSTREKDGHTYLFAVNEKDREGYAVLPDGSVDLLTGERRGGRTAVPFYGVLAVLLPPKD